MTRATAAQLGGANRCAFLDAVAWSEIGAALLAATDDGYDVLEGATPEAPLTFPSYADHPVVTLSATEKSTAAGRYQILSHYWPAYKALLKLPDFGPVSQDLYALQQLKESKALYAIDDGRFADAIEAVAHIWASLPGSPYGQRTNTYADLAAAYTAAGGTLA